MRAVFGVCPVLVELTRDKLVPMKMFVFLPWLVPLVFAGAVSFDTCMIVFLCFLQFWGLFVLEFLNALLLRSPFFLPLILEAWGQKPGKTSSHMKI